MQSATQNAAMVAGATPLPDWLVILPIIIPLIAAALLIMLRRAVKWHPAFAVVVLLINTAVSFALLLKIMDGGPVAMTMGNWLPPFGISFAADLVGAILVITSSFAVLAVALFAIGDVSKRERRFGFYPLLLTLLVGVNGSFLTGDIFNLYVWFEVFLISSFGLIILGGDAKQLDGAVKYCFINLVATTLFLVATGFLYGAYGTLSMADLNRIIDGQEFTGSLAVISVLYLLAFAMKAAAFPLYFWLPASYHTPKVVVSALFAGLLTKVGIYALLRTFTIVLPAASGSWLMSLLYVIAILTMVVGVIGALVQTDLRRLLSYVLVGSIGFMMFGFSLQTVHSIAATIYYMVHSMLVMTALYLSTGLVAHYKGSLCLTKLSGVYKDAPFLSFLFLIMIFMAAGFPPFSGFWPKVALVSESLRAELYFGTAVILFSSVMNTIALGRAFALGFWRSGVGEMETNISQRREVSSDFGDMLLKAQYVPLLILIIAAIIIGLMPQILYDVSLAGANGLLQPAAYIKAVFGGAL